MYGHSFTEHGKSPEPTSAPVSFQERQRSRREFSILRSALLARHGRRIPLDAARVLARAFDLGWASAARAAAVSDLRGTPLSSTSTGRLLDSVESFTSRTRSSAPELGRAVEYHGSYLPRWGERFYVTEVTHGTDASGRTDTRYALHKTFPGTGRPVLSQVRPQSVTLL